MTTEGDKKLADAYFRLNAKLGITKHLGGSFGTDELLGLCHVTPDSYILEVGCGVGLTTAYIAKNFGCKIMAIDLRPEMLEIAKNNVKDRGVDNHVELKLANAEELSFEDNTFDAVITESVVAFTEKPKAIAEFVRVCKKGGYVGLSEMTWKDNAPDEIKDFLHQVAGGVCPLDKKGWTELVAGLRDVVAKTEDVKYFKQFRGEMKIYGWGYMLRAIGKSIMLYFKDPEFKSDIKEMKKFAKKGTKGLMKHACAGLYVGRK